MERIETTTVDITQENICRLAELFPSVATEITGVDGNMQLSIDIDGLRDLLGETAEGQRERYQFTWPGKRDSKIESRRPIDKTMRPEPSKSVNWDETGNLYIEGDNLEALKILRNTYAGKIKLIYIDPPYNTGRDFVYDDDFARTHAEYIPESGDFDDEGGRLVANLESNGRFHSDWCSMIYPRLLLARDLLSSDGAIFISIDDHELFSLKLICDEVFSSRCFISLITRPTGTHTGVVNKAIVGESDYILVYAKDINAVSIDGLPMSEKDAQIYDMKDEGGRFLIRPLRRTGGENRREDRPNMYFPIEAPDGTMVYPIGPTGYESRWICNPEGYEYFKKEGRIFWKQVSKDGSLQWQVYQKFYFTEKKKAVSNLWSDIEGNKKATRDLRELFSDTDADFDFPKPIALLERILQIGNDPDALVLDFFSGSASMAHAVMRLNNVDGGSRRFILVQLPELVDNDYLNLCNLGEERIRRAGAKIVAEVEGANRQLKLGEEPKPVPDVGFRVLRIDSSNFTDTYATPDGYDQDQLHLFEDNVKPDRSDLDLLFQVLPTLRIPYSATIDEIEVCGKRAFDVNHGQLVACFDVEVGADCIEQIAKMRPIYAVFRDASMADDATEANFEELFKTFSPDTVRKVI